MEKINNSETKFKHWGNKRKIQYGHNETKENSGYKLCVGGFIMSEYKLKPGKLGEKIVDTYKGIEEKFVDTFLEEDGSLKTGGMAEKATSAYQKIEDAVVGGYKKVEDTFVGGYKKVEDAFVDAFLEKVEDSGKVSQEHTTEAGGAADK